MPAASDPVRRAVATWVAAYAPDEPLMVAVSGGADSLALALAVRAEVGDRATAVTVDHGLQDGSADRAAWCAELLQDIGIAEVRVIGVTIGTAGGPEAAARDARYAALLDAAVLDTAVPEGAGDGAAAVPMPMLLGHTLDDQAETVLLGLARGSGPRSIAGMLPWRAPWGRPLLGVRRADTENTCAAAGLKPWQDPHNLDPAFTRVRVRREVLPLLEEVLGGGVATALARTADQLRDDLTALDDWAAAATTSAALDDGLLIAPLTALPAAVRRRVLRGWLHTAGVTDLTAAHLYRLDDLVARGRPGAAVRLPGGVDAVLDGERLTLHR